MLKGQELFLITLQKIRVKKKNKRGDRKVFMVAKLKKKKKTTLREKNNLYILG